MSISSQYRNGVFRHVIAVVVLATCLRVWFGPLPFVETAQAQIPDSGLQRKLLLEEAKQSTQLLRDIKQILTSHTFNVRMEGADNQADTPLKGRAKDN